MNTDAVWHLSFVSEVGQTSASKSTREFASVCTTDASFCDIIARTGGRHRCG